MGFGKFLSIPEYDITIVTHRDIFQNTALESSRFAEEYEKLSAVINIDRQDMEKFGITDNDPVVVRNNFGKIIVLAQGSGYEEPHPGVAYMLNSPWSNALVSNETGGSGVPSFKSIKAVISKAKDEPVTTFRP
ncbi:MAG: formylmethanofuran dehydrogenase [Methanosarcinaceae archaeon]|nr:formylmethanofuran dehydrogenase [Methanosarcinaceae archaeon]